MLIKQISVVALAAALVVPNSFAETAPSIADQLADKTGLDKTTLATIGAAVAVGVVVALNSTSDDKKASTGTTATSTATATATSTGSR